MKATLPISKKFEIDFRKFKRKWEDVELDPDSALMLVKELRDLFGLTLQVSDYRDKEQNYFRARKGWIKDITDPTEFTYPKNSENSGRCNIKAHPVFYGSQSARVAMAEIEVEEGDDCYVGLWTAGNNYPKYSQFIWDSNASSSKIKGQYDFTRDKFLNVEDQETGQKIFWLLTEFTKLFVGETHTVASALSHDLIYNQELDGIEYLDVKSKEWYNYALRPSFADKLMLKAIFHQKIGKDGNYNFVKIGKLDNDEIVWEEYTKAKLDKIMADQPMVDKDGKRI